MASKALSDLVIEVSDLLHEGDKVKAATRFSERLGNPKPASKEEATTVLLALLHSLLGAKEFILAARLLWHPNVFTSEPQCVKSIWNAVTEGSQVLLQGGSSMSKSYGPSVWLLLDWMRDPHYTRVVVLGPKRDHLVSNVFSTLNRLYNNSSLPLPGKIGDLFIGASRGDMAGCIQGLVVPRGGKGVALQGLAKAPPRDKPHPVFGALGRVRVYLDELEDMPPLIHQDLGNVVAGIDFKNPDLLKVIASYNPKHINGPVASLAEPKGGWDSFDLEEDQEWVSKRGWQVVRLDPHRSENVIQGKKIYPGLQTVDALEALRLQAGGEDTAAYMTFGRGAFPMTSASTSAVPQAWLTQSVGTVVWRHNPDTLFGIDLSRGGDLTTMAEVKFGTISERRWQGWESEPARRLVFPRPRPCLFVTQIHEAPSGDNVETANNVIARLRAMDAKPYHVNFDPGGPGGGASDIVAHQWSSEVMTTWFGGGATSRRIMSEDPKPADEQGYRQTTDEMWAAMRRYIEHGFIVFDPDMSEKTRTNLFQQLSSRLWKDQSRTKIEPKNDYKRRFQMRSPDEADSVALAVHLARIRLGLLPSVKDGARASAAPGDDAVRALQSPARRREALIPPTAVIFGDRESFFEQMENRIPERRHDPNYLNDHL